MVGESVTLTVPQAYVDRLASAKRYGDFVQAVDWLINWCGGKLAGRAYRVDERIGNVFRLVETTYPFDAYWALEIAGKLAVSIGRRGWFESAMAEEA